MSKTDDYLRKAWDDALLALLVQQPGLDGEALLTAVIVNATDAVARLKEQGLIVGSEPSGK